MEAQILIAFGVGLLLMYLMAKFFVLPLKLLSKLIVNGVLGFLILIVINFFGEYIGFLLPVNYFTALVAGFLGLPGLVLLILLQQFF